MVSKKEVLLLEEINSRMKAIIESQAVLRDSMIDDRKCLRIMIHTLDDLEATSEVMGLSLRRKIDIDSLHHLERRIVDIERRIPVTH
jgi:hypothetical protein